MRTRQPITPVEHALLGLLHVAPRHGYELAAHFAPGSDVGLVCLVPTSLLYSHLWRLERLGYVVSSGGESGNRRQRRVYRPTPAGEAEFDRWRRTPVQRIREIRQDFLLKLYFARLLADVDAGTLIAGQVAACRDYAAWVAGEQAGAPAESFAALVLGSRHSAAEATIRWLENLSPQPSALSRQPSAISHQPSAISPGQPAGARLMLTGGAWVRRGRGWLGGVVGASVPAPVLGWLGVVPTPNTQHPRPASATVRRSAGAQPSQILGRSGARAGERKAPSHPPPHPSPLRSAPAAPARVPSCAFVLTPRPFAGWPTRLLVIAAFIALAGCTAAGQGGSGEQTEVVVFAAASLAEPFKEVAAAFKGTHPGQKVRLNFGGSNQLRAQIEQGARTDVFAAASLTEMEKAQASGSVGAAAQVFARNRLTAIVPRDNPIADLRDLARPGRKVVVAGPGVPAGAYTLELLYRLSADPAYGADFKARVLANVVSQETDVKQVAAKVQLGEADAGFVYVSDVTPATAEHVTALAVPEQHNPVAAYPIGVTTGARNAEAGAAFVKFVLSDEGQRILGRHGFLRGREWAVGSGQWAVGGAQ